MRPVKLSNQYRRIESYACVARIVPVTQTAARCPNNGSNGGVGVVTATPTTTPIRRPQPPNKYARTHTTSACVHDGVCLRTINRTTLIRSNCACVCYYIIYCSSELMGARALVDGIDFAFRCAHLKRSHGRQRAAARNGLIETIGPASNMICVQFEMGSRWR